jgi:hypothetical protein
MSKDLVQMDISHLILLNKLKIIFVSFKYDLSLQAMFSDRQHLPDGSASQVQNHLRRRSLWTSACALLDLWQRGSDPARLQISAYAALRSRIVKTSFIDLGTIRHIAAIMVQTKVRNIKSATLGRLEDGGGGILDVMNTVLHSHYTTTVMLAGRCPRQDIAHDGGEPGD